MKTVIFSSYVIFAFIFVTTLSGIFHETGHYLTCRLFYNSENCMVAFSFITCRSMWPICIGHSPNIAVEAAGGIFSGIILLAIYFLMKRKIWKKGSRISFAIGSIFFVLAFMQITQGLEEGFLPSIYSNQSSIWNVIILIAGTAAGVLCFLWISKRFHVAQGKRK